MDIQTDCIEPVTPGLSYDCTAEDSGYHTFTPGSSELPDVTEENFIIQEQSTNSSHILDVKKYDDGYDDTPGVYFRTHTKNNSVTVTTNEIYKSGMKWFPAEDTNHQTGSGLLYRFTDFYNSSISPDNFQYSGASDFKSDSCFGTSLSNPTTPVKKACKNKCNLNSPDLQKMRKNILVMHSLSCDKKVLQSLKSKQTKTTPKYNVKPNQRIDIIKMLHKTAGAIPPLIKIFSYLSHSDIFNFTLVSQDWQKVWQDVSETKKQEEHYNYLIDMRESQENRMSTPKLREPHQTRPLMEIQNVSNRNALVNPLLSPIKSPRTLRFKRYTTNSLDVCQLVSCVKCEFPSKITKEATGEMWAECTGPICSFQFCSICKCKRHTGKCPIQYDLDGPSPSKRSRKKNIAGTMKSRKNLRRLL